jgi:MoxR-like ATPase
VLGAKARALLQGRAHVAYDDVRALALPVLRHRLLLNFQAQSEKVTADSIVTKLLGAVPTPRSAL